MMRKIDVDQYAARRPFQPFEIRMVDGQRFRFERIEQFLVAREHLITLDRRARAVWISIGLITTIGPVFRGGRRRSGKNGGRKSS
jgi:hypothetical protein